MDFKNELFPEAKIKLVLLKNVENKEVLHELVNSHQDTLSVCNAHLVKK